MSWDQNYPKFEPKFSISRAISLTYEINSTINIIHMHEALSEIGREIRVFTHTLRVSIYGHYIILIHLNSGTKKNGTKGSNYFICTC